MIFHGPDLHWYDPECLAWHWHWNTWKRKKRGSHWILIADRYNSYNRYESCEKSNTPQLASSMTDKARTPTREQRVEGARSTDGGWRWSTASARRRSLNGDHWLALFDQSPFNALVGDQRLSYYRQWKVCLQAKAGATVVDQNPDYDQLETPWSHGNCWEIAPKPKIERQKMKVTVGPFELIQPNPQKRQKMEK